MRSRLARLSLCLAAVCIFGPCARPAAATEVTAIAPFDEGHAPFPLRLGGERARFSTSSIFVMPAAEIALETDETVDVVATGGVLDREDGRRWRWKAPARPGLERLEVRDRSGRAAAVHAFVMRPFDGRTRIGEFAIGRYLAPPSARDPAYRRPEGLIEVTAETIDASVSPHFRLGQFLCKQEGDFPKYLALGTTLVAKLEALLAELARRGMPAPTLTVMSGYRTPAYNAAIGNETGHSRHLYGDAADVYLDRDGDDAMDDVDGDGRVSVEDARALLRIVDETLDPELSPSMMGGLAAYAATAAHGPFLHVDTRGRRARW